MTDPIHWVLPSRQSAGFYCGTQQYRYIGSRGNFTTNLDEVTCKKCLAKIAKHIRRAK